MCEDQDVVAQRSAIYGHPLTNMRATSLQLEGVLIQFQSNNPGQRLPEWWAPMVQVVTKLNRIASGIYHVDNFVDLRNYLGFIEAMQREPTKAVSEAEPIHESGR